MTLRVRFAGNPGHLPGVTDFSDAGPTRQTRIDLSGPGVPDSLIYFVGTATMIIRLAGISVLTDPNYLHRGQRAYLGHGLWSKRRTEPAFPAGGMTTPDVIDLSHLHGDHFDRVARRALAGPTPVLTTPSAARTLRRGGFPMAHGMRTWEVVEVARDDARLRVTATPGRHTIGAAGVCGFRRRWGPSSSSASIRRRARSRSTSPATR